jgi:phosphopantothenoylcysteine synthetase/decarboxylase
LGGGENEVTLIREDGEETWDPMTKEAVAKALILRIADELK